MLEEDTDMCSPHLSTWVSHSHACTLHNLSYSISLVHTFYVFDGMYVCMYICRSRLGWAVGGQAVIVCVCMMYVRPGLGCSGQVVCMPGLGSLKYDIYAPLYSDFEI